MDALDLAIEQRVGVDRDPLGGRPSGKVDLVGGLDPLPFGAKALITNQRLEFAKLIEIGDPTLADGGGDEAGQPRVALEQPAPGRDSVRLVVEAAWKELMEVGKDRRFQNL